MSPAFLSTRKRESASKAALQLPVLGFRHQFDDFVVLAGMHLMGCYTNTVLRNFIGEDDHNNLSFRFLRFSVSVSGASVQPIKV
jgi:hypothetical protein